MHTEASSSIRGWSSDVDHHKRNSTPEKTKCGVGHEWYYSFPVAPQLIQNCDLPPPVKMMMFSAAASQQARPQPPPSITSNNISQEVEDDKFSTITEHSGIEEWEDRKLSLLKALQLSQTRARTAERNARLAKRDMDSMTTLLLQESLRLFAHRQWIKILELEVSQLHSQKQNQKHQQLPCRCSTNNQLHSEYEKWSSAEEHSEGSEDDTTVSFTWCMTLALCLGIAGVGFAFGCRCLF